MRIKKFLAWTIFIIFSLPLIICVIIGIIYVLIMSIIAAFKDPSPFLAVIGLVIVFIVVIATIAWSIGVISE